MHGIPELFAPSVVAGLLGLDLRTLANWRSEGRGPEFIKVGGRVRYPGDSLKSWLDANRSGSSGRTKWAPSQDGPETSGEIVTEGAT